jgi:hypothetical protein
MATTAFETLNRRGEDPQSTHRSHMALETDHR